MTDDALGYLKDELSTLERDGLLLHPGPWKAPGRARAVTTGATSSTSRRTTTSAWPTTPAERRRVEGRRASFGAGSGRRAHDRRAR